MESTEQPPQSSLGLDWKCPCCFDRLIHWLDWWMNSVLCRTEADWSQASWLSELVLWYINWAYLVLGGVNTTSKVLSPPNCTETNTANTVQRKRITKNRKKVFIQKSSFLYSILIPHCSSQCQCQCREHWYPGWFSICKGIFIFSHGGFGLYFSFVRLQLNQCYDIG